MYVYKHNYSPEYSPILATYQNTKLWTNTLIGQSHQVYTHQAAIVQPQYLTSL